jgi:hypothetical protein
MHRRITVLSAFFVVAFSSAFAFDKTSNDPAFAEIDSIVKSLSEITGLAQKHEVPYGRMKYAPMNCPLKCLAWCRKSSILRNQRWIF